MIQRSLPGAAGASLIILQHYLIPDHLKIHIIEINERLNLNSLSANLTDATHPLCASHQERTKPDLVFGTIPLQQWVRETNNQQKVQNISSDKTSEAHPHLHHHDFIIAFSNCHDINLPQLSFAIQKMSIESQ